MEVTHRARDRAVNGLLVGMALVAAGYPAFVSDEITLGAPLLLLPALIWLLGDRRPQLPWIVFTTVLLGWSLVSYAIMGGAPSRLVHTGTMYLPFAALAFRVRRAERLVLRFAVVTVFLLEARILVAFLAAGNLWKPWQVDDGNMLVARLNVLLPLVYVSWLSADNRTKSRLPYVALMVGACLCVFLVLSRAGMGILTALVVLALCRAHWRNVIGIGAAAAAAWVLAPGVRNAFLKKARIVGFSPVAPRRAIWNEAYAHWRTSPWLGVGPGNSSRVLIQTDSYHAHNNVVQAFVETGWIGGLLILGWTLYLAALATRLFWAGGRSTFWGLSLLAYLLYAMVSAPIQRPDFTLAVILILMAVRERSAE